MKGTMIFIKFSLAQDHKYGVRNEDKMYYRIIICKASLLNLAPWQGG